MDGPHGQLTRWILFLVPLLAIGCMPAEDAGHYETVHAYNKVTGTYFDVKVPYHYEAGPDGTIVERAPTREETDSAVDNAVWNAESSASIDNYVHGRGSGSSSQSDWESRSPMDTTTPVEGNGYHEPTPFDDDDQSGGAPPSP